MLDVEANDSSFDTQIKIHINSALSVLREVGCGPQDHPFFIKDSGETWNDFLGEDSKMLDLAREFIYVDAKPKFDTSISSAMQSILKQTRDEDLWRINHEYEISTPNGE